MTERRKREICWHYRPQAGYRIWAPACSESDRHAI